MADFRIEELRFARDQIELWGRADPRHQNWPVVYTLSSDRQVYVGESLNAAGRFKQHLDSGKRTQLRAARVILDERFNKSACLNLESYLIRLFAGDGRFEVLNGNFGVTDADYYGREDYRRTFDEIFEELRSRGVFTRSIPEIENSDLFKLSPFKALTQDQMIAVEDIVSGLFDDIEAGRGSTIAIEGAPGTGKTVVAIFLMKLLSDIRSADLSSPPSADTLLAEFFVPGYQDLLRNFRVGLVVPQQSLRRSIEKVFRRTPGLSRAQVLGVYEAARSNGTFDLLVVDEAHRLNQRAAQAAGPLNARFREINVELFGQDDLRLTQLDWMRAKSTHQILLVDGAQAVRPADLSPPTIEALMAEVRATGRRYRLSSQMRVRAGDDYVGYVRGVLDGTVTTPRAFPGYDLRFFDDVGQMYRAVRAAERRSGLSRMLAGFAWPWVSKGDKHAYDIELDGQRLRWNSTDVDWVNTPTSVDEVGSIHTIQGYDLNVAGVIIGGDLRWDEDRGRIVFDRRNYHDGRGMTNNRLLGITYTDDDILGFVRNIYAVLLTRGMLGTYVYVCDPGLRAHLRPFFSVSE